MSGRSSVPLRALFCLALLLKASSHPTSKFSSFRSYGLSPFRTAESLIRNLNLVPAMPEIDGEEGFDNDPLQPRLVERKLNFDILGDAGSTVPVEQLGHHAGYYRLNRTHAAKMFYFFFESRGESSAPVVVWLTGGPGCSSELALFYENGPFKIANNLSLIWTDYGWDKASNLIYVDQPTGTGFSYSTDVRDIRFGERGISDDLYDFLQAFFQEHSGYLKNELYIIGESYAGHYIPAATERVHRGNREKHGLHLNLKGFAIGNGLTNPGIQYSAYADYAYSMGIIGEKAYKGISKIYPVCELTAKLCGVHGIITCIASLVVCNSIFDSILLFAGDINYYDIRKKCQGSLCYDFSNLEKFLNQKSVKNALGVGDRKFVPCNPLVYEALLTDWMKNFEEIIPALIEDGIRLLVYAGEYDLICNWLGNYRWVGSMKWTGNPNFSVAPFVPFIWTSKFPQDS
ncbi:serine carboxypeptidase-like 49 isoform X2 [Phalaenopsis equestris]|uniref:serine carboxypeptidase-like 49 isoform X2 n=1 Tax=Phalaenopsis equestris TaxID=78828 RepID=UPI0009E27EB7|nr:serine carboxypeptidase-like 49 isoform X2 [Phalaenopsis equestris]